MLIVSIVGLAVVAVFLLLGVAVAVNMLRDRPREVTLSHRKSAFRVLWDPKDEPPPGPPP